MTGDLIAFPGVALPDPPMSFFDWRGEAEGSIEDQVAALNGADTKEEWITQATALAETVRERVLQLNRDG